MSQHHKVNYIEIPPKDIATSKAGYFPGALSTMARNMPFAVFSSQRQLADKPFIN
jgi:hypothetical protein